MSGLLNVGTRALLANQAALSTTGHNIANVNTLGYSRQTVVMGQVQGQNTGSGYIGKGVQIVTVDRQHSDFLIKQSTAANSVAAGDTARATKLYQMEDVFPGGASGLGAAITDLMGAFGDAAITPTDLTARSVALARTDELATRFNNASARLDDLASSTKQELTSAVTAVNRLTAQIADVNEQIARATSSGHAPNDLLDQRDQFINDLNGYVQTSQLAAEDGTVNVFLGSQPLVLGVAVTPLTLNTDDPTGAKLTIVRDNATTVLDENAIGGGSIAGLLKFNNSDLADARNQLGRMAATVSSLVNAQHSVGVDLNGKQGTALFTTPQLDNVYDSTGVKSTAVGVTLTDTTALKATDYELHFDAAGTGGTLIRTSDGSKEAFTVTGGTLTFAGGTAATLDGLRFAVGTPAPAGNTTLTAKPFEVAAAKIKSTVSDPRALAVASPIQPTLGATNTGTLTVASIAATPALATPTSNLTLTFAKAVAPATQDTYSYTDAGGATVTANYVPGRAIVVEGRSITLKGTPAAGDTVTIGAATAAYRGTSAGNASALAGIADVAAFDGATVSDGYSHIIAGVGLRVQNAQYASQVSSSIAKSLTADKTAISGVNLDEEAGNLLMYQQAYQASAKLIQVSQSIFDSLIQTMGR
ncbi:flagellar hook-associated protein FlgK [Xylophilus ampelinus]|uniref:Flagellar hook-associated protein 1 n=1 Tax=Xylophilus ampelinus TaxID=54067 RepID=A0A318SJS1_9BURK|nr:flagellar hook-associated protein FlgK [Xylophilus ampelinus]MCS4511234.1 flagellar hook-associated protein FlgK [Xylophilus ampelinus]PYE75013.1 flagellar hook-associated protein 1 FlgK [Xylophilus ampelinus]